MADGMFNSSSSSDYGSDYGYYHSSGGGGDASIPVLAGFCLIVLVIYLAVTCSENKALEQERVLDRTAYHQQAQENLEQYLSKRPWGATVIRDTVWIEPGSSRRDNFHCKGVQFDTADGFSHTLCCAVKGSDPDCIRI